MTMRNLDALIAPSSVVLVGANDREGSVGAVLVRNLTTGGFAGPVHFVAPRGGSIGGRPVHPRIADLPAPADLAVIATPPETIPELIDQLGHAGTRAAVVISAGFGETGAAGRALQARMLEAARPHLLRVLGPNCIGALLPRIGLNASFAHLMPQRGDIALVAQSGAVLTAMLDWAAARGIGFSHALSMGAMADVDLGDVLDYLAGDAAAKAVLLYVEGIANARKFMSAARRTARAKPVVVIKAGRQAAGARAAQSHTGALAGSFAVYEAAFHRAGLLHVSTLEALFDAAETLASGLKVRGNRLAIITNGGGIGVLATDRLVEEGGTLAELAPVTLDALDAALPPTWSHANPIDVIGDAGPDRYRAAVAAARRDPNVDAVLAINCPVAIADSTAAAQAVAEAAAGPGAPVVACWLGGTQAARARSTFAAAHIPVFDLPDEAVRAFMRLDRHRRQRALLRTAPATVLLPPADMARARAPVAAALAEGREWLTEPEAQAVLAAHGIPTVPTTVAADPEAAATAARGFSGPYVLKLLSRDITHKSDVGGVALDLDTPDAVREAAETMRQRVARSHPDARIDGFVVQPMIRRPGAYETIVGMTDDPTFGPAILFGEGGTAAEVIGDKALALAPLDAVVARDLIERTRLYHRLAGFRDRPPADFEALISTLVGVGRVAVAHPEIAELDINPLLVDARGVVALDARIRVTPPRLPGDGRLAIKPYPADLARMVTLASGLHVLLRPIRPEDEPALQAMIEASDPRDLRRRFFSAMRRAPDALIARLTQLDYDREIGFVVESDGALLAHGGLLADPDVIEGEYAVLVRSDRQGEGLGRLLMDTLIAQGRAWKLDRIVGDVLADNRPMLRMCHELGFTAVPEARDPAVVRVTLALRTDGEEP